jgi:hypothetical protein
MSFGRGSGVWRIRPRGLAGMARAALRCSFGNGFSPAGAIDPGLLSWAAILDPAWLAVLADALEDAGCTDQTILCHLRSAGPHGRGCWALDHFLGKS